MANQIKVERNWKNKVNIFRLCLIVILNKINCNKFFFTKLYILKLFNFHINKFKYNK